MCRLIGWARFQRIGVAVNKLFEPSVQFRGTRAESAPMTWGQGAIWQSIRWLGDASHYFNIPRVLPLPPGAGLDRVVAAVGETLSRHEALRTLFHETPDGPVQQVLAGGTLSIGRSDVPEGRGREAAEEAAAELAGTSFRYGEELPIRCTLVSEGLRPAYLAIAFAHISVDFRAVQLVEAEMLRLLEGVSDPLPDWQPLDQARHENGATGSARGSAACDYWRRTLGKVPAPLFAGPPQPTGKDRFVRLRMDSPAAAVAATMLAGRCQVTTGSVLLAATAAALASYTGHDTVALQLIAANRYNDRERRLIGAMSQNALFVLDLAAGSFEDAARRTFVAATNAYRFSRYDVNAMRPVLDRAGADPDRPVDLSAFFNDARMQDHWEGLPATELAADELRALAERTEISFIGSWERQDAKYFVHTTHLPDRCRLYLMADTAFIPVAAMENLLRGIEKLLVENAIGDLPFNETAAAIGFDSAPA
ncbi:condensation domain-containing protein [Kitasatospora phosalacinea]|uniref:condensation domain-containing protein n=1 Tax=Kitasatospora phosalacinea TaxID=2065 RepID=UPI0035DC9EC7